MGRLICPLYTLYNPEPFRGDKGAHVTALRYSGTVDLLGILPCDDYDHDHDRYHHTTCYSYGRKGCSDPNSGRVKMIHDDCRLQKLYSHSRGLHLHECPGALRVWGFGAFWGMSLGVQASEIQAFQDSGINKLMITQCSISTTFRNSHTSYIPISPPGSG